MPWSDVVDFRFRLDTDEKYVNWSKPFWISYCTAYLKLSVPACYPTTVSEYLNLRIDGRRWSISTSTITSFTADGRSSR